MKYSVEDFVGRITPEQRDLLNRALQPGEEVQWAT